MNFLTKVYLANAPIHPSKVEWEGGGGGRTVTLKPFINFPELCYNLRTILMIKIFILFQILIQFQVSSSGNICNSKVLFSVVNKKISWFYLFYSENGYFLNLNLN
jgi:hypothetical protein